MARKPVNKELIHTRLASTYGGWIYCEHCGENIGYLCYVTYDHFIFNYKCQCDSEGSLQIAFDDLVDTKISHEPLISIKNRLCCPHDLSPLLTVLDQKLLSYQYKIDCVCCKTTYQGEKTL